MTATSIKSLLVLAALSVLPITALADSPREEAAMRATKPAVAHDLQQKRMHARHRTHHAQHTPQRR